MKIALLENRSLVGVSGDDAEKFLENIVTCKVEGMAENTSAFGALLTPQGKIMFDFFMLRTGEGFLIDLHSALKDEFVKRMTFYKLRAKVEITPVAEMNVYAAWAQECESGSPDPRLKAMGRRIYSQTTPQGETADYLAHRIDCGMPEGGIDFEYGNAYPHEVLMDQFGGVDFKKGCYVGQEVVSRMQHRGTTKKRVVKVRSATPLADSGTAITADGKPAGTLGSVSRTTGLALLRLDRVSNAADVLAGDTPIEVLLPEWVTFKMPGDGESASND